MIRIGAQIQIVMADLEAATHLARVCTPKRLMLVSKWNVMGGLNPLCHGPPECGPPSWAERRPSCLCCDKFVELQRTSPGWPAFAGHDIEEYLGHSRSSEGQSCSIISA